MASVGRRMQPFRPVGRMSLVSTAVVVPWRGAGVVGWAADDHYVRLVEEHGPALLRLATLLTGNRQDAEDAVQEAFISVALAWPRVRSETAPAYLRTALVRRTIDTHRNRRETPVDAVPDRAVMDRGLLRYEDDRAFAERVRGLSPQQRAVIVLRFCADLPDAEIGRLLRCSVQTVRSQAHRALAKLRDAEHAGVEGGGR